MRRFTIWTLALVALAIYLIVSAFVPVFAMFDVFDHVYLLLAIFFVLLGLGGRNRSIFLVFLGLAFLSPYFHDLLPINYAEWTLFGGVLLLGLVLDQVFKPKSLSHKILDETDSGNVHDGRQLLAKAFFSDNKCRSQSQALDDVAVDVQFGSLKLDLKQAQFMTDAPIINVSANFGEVKIRLPEGYSVDTSGLNTTFADVSIEELYLADKASAVTVRLMGSLLCAELDIVY